MSKDFVKIDSQIKGSTEKAYCLNLNFTDGKKAGKASFWFPKSWAVMKSVDDKTVEVYLELWQVERSLEKLAETMQLAEPVFSNFYSLCSEQTNIELTELKQQSKKVKDE